MNRVDVVEFVDHHVLSCAASLYGTTPDALRICADHLGCQNLVYDYGAPSGPRILRISYRADRTLAQIQAEVDFISYLADNGARVSRAAPSLRGNLAEQLQVEEHQFVVVSFEKGKGMRVPDNQYRYRPGVPIDEYCQNWGQTLGQMHRLAMSYRPASADAARPEWLDWHGYERIERYIPETLPKVRQRFRDLLAKVASLPRPSDAYGLIHSDFNDGNFTVDYTNGNITVFDFDDACYGWFVYELACAWEGGIGRTMFEPDAARRKAYMDHYFGQVMEGYEREHSLPSGWMDLLPTFIKIVEMETLTETLASWLDNALSMPEDEQRSLAYLVRCVEEDLPDLGFYTPLFSHEHPFEVDGGVNL